MLHPEQITGVVLAGGKSSRFGSNKALCKYGDKYFMHHIIELMRPYTKEIVISGYRPEYEDIEITILKDEYPDIGPIGGIYTALKESTTPWILVLTCDMPLVSKEIIMMMLASCKGDNIIGWQHDKIFTTFPLLISKSALPAINNAINEKRYRIKQMFEIGNSRKIIIPDALLPNFANINTQDDYKELNI